MGKLTSTERKMLVTFFKEHPEEVVELLDQILEKNFKSLLNNNETLEDLIAQRLIEYGMPQNMKGFEYIIDAVVIGIDNPKLMSSLDRNLFPIIAEHFNVKPSQVEKNIRHAINVMWNYANVETRKEICGIKSIIISDNKEWKTSTKKFLVRLVNEYRKIRKLLTD